MSQLFQCLSILISSLVIVHSDDCPTIKTISSFEPQKYLGKWYEIQRYPQLFESDYKCVTATYTLNPNGTVGVLNQAVIPPNTPTKIQGLATANPTNPANLTVEFPGVPVKGKYWVIDTDYKTYSLVYSCGSILGLKIESSWILSRNRTLDSKIVTKLTEQLTKVKSDTKLFKTTDQKDCKD